MMGEEISALPHLTDTQIQEIKDALPNTEAKIAGELADTIEKTTRDKLTDTTEVALANTEGTTSGELMMESKQ